jgi:hypothetical protein
MAGETGFPGGILTRGNQPFLPAGRAASQILRILANVTQNDPNVIGSDTYRAANIATDSTKTVTGLATTGPGNSPQATITMAAHGLKVNDVIRIENEIMLVIGVLNVNQIVVRRGTHGTSIATHADATAIFVEVALGGGSIPVAMNNGVTPTLYTASLVWAINNLGRERVKAYLIDVNTVLVVACDRPAKDGGAPRSGASAIATTETFTSGSNVWDAATLAGGRDAGGVEMIRHVPTAAQVTAGKIVLAFPYVPVVEAIYAQVTSSGAVKVWDGAATVSGTNVVIDNAGGVDWAATDTLWIFIRATT